MVPYPLLMLCWRKYRSTTYCPAKEAVADYWLQYEIVNVLMLCIHDCFCVTVSVEHPVRITTMTL